jgi:hypothetical protein
MYSMNAHRLKAVMSQDGQLLLNGLPFLAGDMVEVIVLSETPETRDGVAGERLGDTTAAPSITGVSSDQMYLTSISNVMEEWGTEADEAAYRNL